MGVNTKVSIKLSTPSSKRWEGFMSTNEERPLYHFTFVVVMYDVLTSDPKVFG